MYLQSIQSYCGKLNISGNVHLKVVPIQWIATFPEFSSEHAYGDPITLIPGKDWMLLPCVSDSINFNDDDNTSSQGETNQFRLDGFIPNDTPNISAILNDMRGYEWIAVLQYKTGESKVIGHPEAPARFRSQFQNKGELSAEKGYRVFFFSESLMKSHFIDTVPLPNACLPGLAINSNGSFSVNVPSNGSTPLPDSILTVNSAPFYNLPGNTDLNIELVDESLNPLVPVSLAGGQIVVASALEVFIPYALGDDTAEITILTGSAGTMTAIDSTGLTTFTFLKNGAAAALPFSVIVTDILTFSFDAAAADGVIKLEGSYA